MQAHMDEHKTSIQKNTICIILKLLEQQNN